MKSIEKYILLTLLFLLPSQLALHFWPFWAFVFGIRVDFLSPAVYLTDTLIFCLLVLSFFTDRRKFVKTYFQNKFFLSVLLLAVLNCIFSTSVFVSLYKWVKVGEFLFFAAYISQSNILDIKSVAKTLFYSAATFSVIGVIQFLKSGTVGGILYWLGERTFNLGTPGIALVSLGGAQHLRAYSTFAHPNSLAGYLGVVLIFCLLSGSVKRNYLNILAVLIISFCFLMTFSMSSYFGLLLTLFLFLIARNKNVYRFGILTFLLIAILLSLLLPLASPSIMQTISPVSSNISQRLDLAYIAGEMISKKFFLGEGLGTFIVNIPAYKGIFTYSWILQPVHNIFLLVFSETGIFGMLFISFLFYKIFQLTLVKDKHFISSPLLFVIFTGLFDHYSLTLQQNLFLLSLLSGLALR